MTDWLDNAFLVVIDLVTPKESGSKRGTLERYVIREQELVSEATESEVA